MWYLNAISDKLALSFRIYFEIMYLDWWLLRRSSIVDIIIDDEWVRRPSGRPFECEQLEGEMLVVYVNHNRDEIS